MAKIINLVLVLSLLLVVASEGQFLVNEILKPPATLKCESVYGVKSGDTCFEIAETFNVPTEFFDSINPNLNCTALFVGQWVCLNGTLS
ncbi:hypothetical protein Pyn_28323 [Prunus yedoensis var. nudiflora]|uniref:LysM domain-containing protein n=1 Tax=Prunus yedoensis var. nudiflora TaxID=2094558 RepID=A0A314YKP2_PRUYE|nr:hypothetical protein Pyn_28323 [Prunus yedoensis var. nudiflora]